MASAHSSSFLLSDAGKNAATGGDLICGGGHVLCSFSEVAVLVSSVTHRTLEIAISLRYHMSSV